MKTQFIILATHCYKFAASKLLMFFGLLVFSTMNVHAQISNPLPLHRFDLKGSLQRNTVSLVWTTENEQNTSRFLIQRSTNGFQYTTVGTKPASGNTNTLTEYRATDEVPFLIQSNMVYYRIRAEDIIDNRFTYSNIIPVKLDNGSEVKVWPNPFLDDVRITYPAITTTTVEAIIYNIAGRIVCQNTFNMVRGLNQVSMTGSGQLPSGSYTIRLIDKTSGLAYTQQLLK